MRFDNAPELQAHYRVCQNVAEAANARDAQFQSIRQTMGIDELEEAGEALGDRGFEARWALMRIPAPDREALLCKLEYLLDPDGAGGGWTEEALSQPVADMRRLLGEARS